MEKNWGKIQPASPYWFLADFPFEVKVLHDLEALLFNFPTAA
jgi:hypothetical protein